MDHIPHCGPHTIRVPYLGNETWDGGNFLGYPQRRGFDYNHTPSPGARSRVQGRDDVVQCIQTWLFFGLLTETMRLANISLNCEQFIEEDHHGNFVTTKALPGYLQALAQFEARQEASGKSRRLATISSFLNAAYECVTILSSLMVDKEDKLFAQSIGGPVMLSVELAGYALAHSCRAIYRDVGGSDADLRTYVHASASFLTAKMLDAGWCPSLTERLSSIGNKELQYVGYTHGPPDPEPQDHSECSINVCSLSQIDECTYSVHHVEESCDCGILEVDYGKMESIVKAGGTPVCRLIAVKANTPPPPADAEIATANIGAVSTSSPVEGPKHSFTLEVESASLQRPYLAISHVWAHGMGNPRHNGLPLCQLVQLQCRVSGAFADNHGKSGPRMPDFSDSSWCKWFWMDTLCVPVRLEAKPLRKRAIIQMRNVYAAAESVLVLDSGLLRHRGPEDNIRIMIRILLSSWYSRLWTMQESVLAKRVMILFGSPEGSGQNAMCILDDWARSFRDEAQYERTARGSTLAGTCLALYQSLRGTTALVKMNNSSAHFLRAVAHRSVSKRDDEAICISTLLGLDLTKLPDPPPPGSSLETIEKNELADRRTVVLLKMIQEVPFSFLFSCGPRLQEPGFRWALKSFLHQTGCEPVLHDSPTVKVTAAGLECTCDGMILMSDVSQCTQFMILDEGGPGIPIGVIPLPANRKYEDQVPRAQTGATRRLALISSSEIGLAPTSTKGPAILVESVEPPASLSGAATEHGANIKIVRFLRLMGMSRLPANQSIIMRMIHDVGNLTGGKVLGPQQKWLIT